MATKKDKYSAGEQGLGYVYQIRFALAHLMKQDESQSLFIEADDDVQLVDVDGQSTLVSLKHKQEGETVGTLSVDFWKSVRIWLNRYARDGRLACEHSFCMATTARVGPSSMLKYFLSGAEPMSDDFPARLVAELDRSSTELSREIKAELDKLSTDERRDFLSRVVIFDSSPRIQSLDTEIAKQLKAVPRLYRADVQERLEGWWTRQAIGVIVRDREPISGAEVWDKVASINSEYADDNLPITFDDSFPAGGIDPSNDTRQFVEQLRAIGMPTDSLELAILDFHRAFSQRSHWARVNVLFNGEMAKFEQRLVDEWKRAKAYVKVTETDTEEKLQDAGQRLYEWAEAKSAHIQIRARVTEEYVRRGTFHILADRKPIPGVHWHPRFLERLKTTLQAN
ncbi:ABC-three component system protein [Caldimonas brevitalea]|uniref:ABC-three component systems C-terminal domain-containing protein n=1 Tax=Caldimonas brevitalea TaxID=413882 RepID=A0A0G3BMH2_9BURK|nr:ABC-three component system protein [Caldimonas brevitalea]AKJ30639.1 hypothetical protein AAW51_3948 [Caldimonas brevitalea]